MRPHAIYNLPTFYNLMRFIFPENMQFVDDKRSVESNKRLLLSINAVTVKEKGNNIYIRAASHLNDFSKALLFAPKS